MRQFKLSRPCLGKEITAQVLQLPQGIHISLYGGDLPHIGAVGIVDPEGNCCVKEFPGHKEGQVCKRWAQALSGAGICPAVIEAGIHYDHITRDGITSVLDITSVMLKEVLDDLRQTRL